MKALAPTEIPTLPLRAPDEVMRFARMGAAHATRLSFMRVLIRELIAGGWLIVRTRFDVDAAGYGTALYRVSRPGRAYTLVAFSHYLPDEMRTDRVIAEAWDATFVLYDGKPSVDEVERLRQNAPRQEAGRYSHRDLVLARANKSLRYFEHVAGRLANGAQPEEALTRSVGYLMRTTAVYGNGKFGIADRFRISDRPELRGPFQAEMLAVYLIRLFTLDLVEHVARMRAPDSAVTLSPRYRRYIGIGNATGLGMAPFLMTHPVLLHHWVNARETALARARANNNFDRGRLRSLLQRAIRHVGEWRVEDERQAQRISVLEDELVGLERQLSRVQSAEVLFQASCGLSLEAQELVASLVIELAPHLVDELALTMASDDIGRLDPAMRLDALRTLIDRHYRWALTVDCGDRKERAQFWYVSEDKLEPRLGNRFEEEGAELERPFAVAHDLQALMADLDGQDEHTTIAAFLMGRPQHRHIVRRIQVVDRFPYGEIHDNLVGSQCHPIDLLRFKLAFFGASKFDPKSDRWTRITMYQGAPLPSDLADPSADDWSFPVL